MSEAFTYPTESVTVNLGDGVERELRYDMGVMRRLKKMFGQSIMTGEALQSIDEDRLPELLFEGLKDREGIVDADALAARIIPAAVPYLIKQFTLAFTGSFPEGSEKNGQSSQPN